MRHSCLAYQSYQCYAEGNQYIAGYTVDVSYRCCTDTESIFDANYNELEDAVDDCTNRIMSELVYNTDEYCNGHGTRCTVSWHDFACDEECKDICKKTGGSVVEWDQEHYCDGVELKTFGRFGCFAYSCSEDDMEEVVVANSAAAGCVIKSVDNVHIDGKPRDDLGYSAAGFRFGGISLPLFNAFRISMFVFAIFWIFV